MSRPAAGPRGGSDTQGVVLGVGAVGVALLGLLVWLPVALARPPGYRGGHPLTVVKGLADGSITWTAMASIIAVAELILFAAAVAGVVVVRGRWKRRRSRIDTAAASMGKAKDLTALTRRGVRESALRLRPSLATGSGRPDPDQLGILIGHTVAGNVELRQSWEDTAIDIWGTRTGKTTARAIPAIVAAPGPVLATSVKGDVVDATRGIGEQRGQIWIFDPQDIYNQSQTWFYNPLASVTSVTAARKLAGHFANAERDPGTKRDAYFDPKGEALTANLLLAAACSHRTILDAYRWCTQETEEEPARLLRAAGFDLAADSVHSVIGLPDKTRGGIYGSAEKLLDFLTDPAVAAWVTPQPGKQPFTPETFAHSSDTLYLLCKGGPGSPAPLVAALTDAVWQAAERAGAAMPGRRLDPPLVSVLDEAANIVRIRDLPKHYSHFGSRGMPVLTILQSYAQGEECWGTQGMRQMWDSANIRTYGGGNADPAFLARLSDIIGEHDVDVRSVTRSRDSRSVSTQTQRRRILDVAALAALPRGRMIVAASGTPVALAKTQPWQHGKHATAIQASLDRYDPAATYNPRLDTPTANGGIPGRPPHLSAIDAL